jgi:glucose-6-phosphate 1-dehydrogenase
MSNPRRAIEMAEQAQPPAPCVLVIFGVAGDLTKRLLVPALYNLRRAKLLPEQFTLVGVARSDRNDEGFRRDLGTALHEFVSGEVAAGDSQWLLERMHYIRGEFDDPAVYEKLTQLPCETGGACDRR